MYDVEKVRKDFSILNQDFIYLDSAASSLTPDIVVDNMSKYYKEYRATVNRAMYKNAIVTDSEYNSSRKVIADYLNANFEEIIFTKSTTNSMNLLARNIVESLSQGDEILVSELEHHSFILPFRELATKKNIVIKYLDVINNTINLETVKSKITANTKLVLLHHVSNVIGDEMDIYNICNYLSEKNIMTVVDGAQGITHLKVDVKKINCDFYAFSAHKVLGPTGIGILYGKSNLLENFTFEYGGDMAHKVSKDALIKKPLPHRLEAGTPSIAEIIGLKYAFLYLNDLDFVKMNEHINKLRAYAVLEMSKIKGLKIYNKDVNTSLITFNFDCDYSGDKIAPHDALCVFSEHNIAIRGGHMCNMLTLDYLKVNGVLRASVYFYNTKKDIDEFVRVCALVPDNWINYMPM